MCPQALLDAGGFPHESCRDSHTGGDTSAAGAWLYQPLGSPTTGWGPPGTPSAAELLLLGCRSSMAGAGVAAPAMMPGLGEGRAILGQTRWLLACLLTVEGDVSAWGGWGPCGTRGCLCLAAGGDAEP